MIMHSFVKMNFYFGFVAVSSAQLYAHFICALLPDCANLYIYIYIKYLYIDI